MNDSSEYAGANGTVLVVCTGNICRSPYIERRLETLLRGSGIRVVSAGIRALVGAPVEPLAAAQLARHGASPEGFAAQPLTPELIAQSDLVLGVTGQHRSAVVRMAPRAVRSAFTYTEFADLASDLVRATPSQRTDGVTWVGQVVARALSRRGQVPRRPEAERDLVDPYGKGQPAYEQMERAIEADLPAVVAALRPPS